MKSLILDVHENSVPEGFADWVKLWLGKSDLVSKRVQILLWDNQLEEAIGEYFSQVNKNDLNYWNHGGNYRIH